MSSQQHAKSLSILVSDTLKAEATHMELKLTHYTSTEDEENPAGAISFEDLKEFCKQFNVKQIFEKHIGPPPEYNRGYVEKFIILTFDSRDRLIDCLNKTDDFNRVVPQIVCLKIDQNEPLQNKLFLSAVEKGKKKASQYASQLNKKLGELISVEEMRSPEWNIRDVAAEHIDVRNTMEKESGGWTIYLPSASNPGDKSRFVDTSISFMATLRMKFELE